MSRQKKIQIRNSTAEYPQNIFATGELDEKPVCRDFRHTAECRGPAIKNSSFLLFPSAFLSPATRCRDAHHIQLTLDYLLDFACHPAGLALYKKLCRYYYTLDPAATAHYVNSYREMWDAEETEDQK